MRSKLIGAAVIALSFGGFACQSRDVPTAGRAQAVEVGTPEPYGASSGRLGGSQPPSEEGRVGGVLRGGGSAAGPLYGSDPGQIQTGGIQRRAGHPVLGLDSAALSYGGQQGMGGGGSEGTETGYNEADVNTIPHAHQNDQRAAGQGTPDAQREQRRR